jgi:hypothetical protein
MSQSVAVTLGIVAPTPSTDVMASDLQPNAYSEFRRGCDDDEL